MLIEGKRLASVIHQYTLKKLKQLKNPKIKIAAVYVGDDPDQLGYLKKKEKVAKKLGIEFELHTFPKDIRFEEFATQLRNISHHPKTTGVIIQQPLPTELQTSTIYNFIPNIKEIEGFSKKSPFYPPIGLAVLTILKYIFLSKIYQNPDQNLQDIIVYPEIKEKYLHKLYENIEEAKLDKFFFKDIFSEKKIVLIGRGLTGGKPIAFTLNDFGIPFINIHSKTPNPDQFLKEADIIISAVGKKIITPDKIKEGVILIDVGQYKENGKIKGDYDEEEIKDIADFYTPITGGIGPLNIAYIYKNLVESAYMQENNIKM